MKAKHVENIEKPKGNNRELEEVKEEAGAREKAGEPQSGVSQRPSRRAKTKEAVLKHLNRDVELLVGEKPDKKASVKKTSGGAGQAGAALANGSGGGTTATHNTGKGSLSRSGTSMGKNSVPKAQTSRQQITQFNSMQVPASIADSKGSTFLESQSQIAPFVSQVAPRTLMEQHDEQDKRAMSKKANEKKKTAEAAAVKTRSSVTKQSIKKIVGNEGKKEIVQQEEESDDVKDEEEGSSMADGEELTETEGNEEMEDEECEEEEEELPDAESAESGSRSEHSSLDLRRRRKLALRQEAGRMAAAANRALRIKMGKSGAQAASRKSIKSGKEACQRKLWNQDEDDAIVSLVQKYGTKRWTYIAQMLKDDYHIGGRTGKQCRERWHNHLDPSIKKSPINNEEEIIIFDAHKVYGNKWADIAKLLQGRSDNCIKNYYYSTLRKHIRRINKSLKQCQVAKVLNLKVKTLTADMLFPLVKDGKISYSQVKNIDHKKFEDLEHTMRMIFNHEDGQQVTQRGIIAAAQNRIKVEKQLEEMRERERQEERDNERRRDKKMLNKRMLPARGTERKHAEPRKRQKLDHDETDSEEPNEESSQGDVDMVSDEEEETQPKITQTDAQNSQATSLNQNDAKEQFSARKNTGNAKMPVLKHRMAHDGSSQGPQFGACSDVAGNAALKTQNSMSFPKGLQLKPPISKKQNAQKPLNSLPNLKPAGSGATAGSNLNDEGPTTGNAMALEQLALGGNLTSGSGRQSPAEAHNVFKSSLPETLHQRVNKMGVTENEDDVTKTDFGNRSNCSGNKQPLQQQERGSQRIRDKKHKKKKKNKRSNDGGKRFGHQSSLFSGLSGLPAGNTLTNVDEIAAQFDQQTVINSWNSFANRIPAQNLADVLAVTNRKQSASKIYPGFYEQMHHPKVRKDQQMSYGSSGPAPAGTAGAAAGVGAHTCSYSGAAGHLSHFPPSYMFQTPYYMGQFYPFHPMGAAGPMFHPDSMKPQTTRALEKQKNSKSSNKDVDQKNQTKQEQSSEQKHEANKDEEVASSENKAKKDEQKEKHLESQNENHFMSHDAMNHYFALTQMSHSGQMHPGPMSLPPQLHALYQKSGHVPPHMLPAHGMPFYPFTGMPLPPHQYQPRERQAHHASAYHKQFTMPITPNNLQQQVFGAEKHLYLADSTGGPSQQQRQPTRTQGNAATPEEGSQEKEKKELGDKKLLTSNNIVKLGLTKRSSSANNLHGQSQSMLQPPAQFNSNITLMINHFGPAPGQAAQAQQNEDTKGLKKTKERSEQRENIQSTLSPMKQISAKKLEQKVHPGANSSVSFKQSFKPQRIDMLQKRFQEAMTSRGVTPNNQGPHPLISASNLLLSHNMFGPSAGAGGGLYHFPGVQASQAAAAINKKENQTLQSRLFAGTPRLFLGQNLSNLHQKIPTSTTAAAAAAAAAQNEFQGSGLLLQSQRNLNSGHTFNASGAFGGGSRMNTKTHAQQQATGKAGNSLITPKVNTVGSDPETHRKLLEKMFSNTNNQDSGEAAPVNLISTTGGAFTKKQGAAGGASNSREGSNRGNSQHNQPQSQTKQLKKGAQNSGESISQSQLQENNHLTNKPTIQISQLDQDPPGLAKDEQKLQQAPQPFHPERDSIGLLYVNPSHLVLDHDPLASMPQNIEQPVYPGGAPPGGEQEQHEPDSNSPAPTPLLGPLVRTITKDKEYSQAGSPHREDNDREADSILDQSEPAQDEAAGDVPMAEDEN